VAALTAELQAIRDQHSNALASSSSATLPHSSQVEALHPQTSAAPDTAVCALRMATSAASMLQCAALDEENVSIINIHLSRIRSLRVELAEKEAQIAEVTRAHDHSRAQYDALKVEHNIVLERLEVFLKAPGPLEAPKHTAPVGEDGSENVKNLAEERQRVADLQGQLAELEENAVEVAKVCNLRCIFAIVSIV
jgi:DNA repair exonuclease SbcCD ATPase subunit